MYSPYLGKCFLDDYIVDRKKRISQIDNIKNKNVRKNTFETIQKELYSRIENKKVKDVSMIKLEENIFLEELLLSIIQKIRLGKVCDIKDLLNLIVQRFEVSKRIYSHYKKDLKQGYGDYESIDRYINVGLILIYTYHLQSNLQYLSTVLKLNDLILSTLDLNKNKYSFTKNLNLLVNAELEKIINLASKNNINL